MRNNRRLFSWPLILLLAAAIHFDWHVARPHHFRLSLGWSHHWVLAIPVFGAAAWFVTAGWPTAVWRASAINLGAAAVVGQVIEPLGEVVYSRLPVMHVLKGTRWVTFAEFASAGLATYAVGVLLALRASALRRTKPPADTT